MGGRLDATNVVRPIAALITPIGFDHTEFLATQSERSQRRRPVSSIAGQLFSRPMTIRWCSPSFANAPQRSAMRFTG